MSAVTYRSLQEIVVAAAEGVRPAERMDVPEAATRYRYLKNVGGYEGYWLNEKTPYLVEPMRELTNDLYSTVVFVGPAQCGKTDMALNYLAYKVRCDPSDMMIVQTTGATARDFSISRIDRLHRHSEEIGSRLLGSHADNVYDKQYKNGMLLRLSWPTINELSGRPVPILWLTDYDRMTMDVDGEGTPYQLAKARTKTFGRNGKVVVETSPGFVVDNPQWVPKTRNEAPPTVGSLSLYNAGDKRRWNWQCVSCKNSFEPDRSLMKWAASEDIEESAATCHLVCPHCEQKYYEVETREAPGKNAMNQLFEDGGNSRWVKDGMLWLKEGIVGSAQRTDTASFWLKGPAAAFGTWSGLVKQLLTAEKEYLETGSENSLKAICNTGWGEAYTPKKLAEARLPEILRSRAKDYGQRVVPHGVRFLVATVDIQNNRFVVQVHGIGPDDIWIIDRYEIKHSKREQEDAPGQLQFINAGSFPEDWRHLVTDVMLKTYPLANDPDRHMAIWQTFSDSGGAEGVTSNAYEFVRWLRRGYKSETGEDLETKEVQEKYPWHPHLFARFHLVKGDPVVNSPRVQLRYPDSQRKDRHAGARGEIPVFFVNTNMMKDKVDKVLDRLEPGGRINFPNWLPISFYKELTVEVKDPKTQKWENPHKYRNESWDLLVYCHAALLHRTIGWEHIGWDNPPTWAAEWDQNDMVFSIVEEETPLAPPEDDNFEADLAKLGEFLG